MHEGFRIDLDEATKAAEVSLPKAIDMLRAPVPVLITHLDDFRSPGKFDAADRIQVAYHEWSEAHGRRLQYACDVMTASATALREIIALYRRVDGRI